MPEPEPLPLQDPELESADEIAQAMFQPELAEQAVVSMLDVLGIGIYKPDGTPIRAGTEASDADFYMFEPEARGLIDMLGQTDQPETWITFRDFHAALAGLGLQASAEDLAQAYADSYAESPDAPISQFVNALTFVDVDAQMPRFTAWLLLLDGFVPPHASADQASVARVAAVNGRFATGPRPGGRGWGTARNRVQSLAGLPLIADPAVILHVQAVIARSSVVITANPGKVHEGHGGPGTPAEITAEVRAAASVFTSPFSGQLLIPVRSVVGAGLPVTWTPDNAMDAHGSAAPLSATTDGAGVGHLTFTPKKEKGNGQGTVMYEASTIRASVPASQIITNLYGLPALGALVPGSVSGVGVMGIEWHEPDIMRIELTNVYDVTIKAIIGDSHTSGTDRFVGDLAQQDNGDYRGRVTGIANGSFSGQAFGRSCSSNWSATQIVEVVGFQDPNSTTGDFTFLFYPISDPFGSMGSGRCPPTRHRGFGDYANVLYAPYNDYGITNPGQGLSIVLPQKPGGDSTYPVPSLPPGSGIIIKNTSWRVHIEFIEPTP